MSVAISALLWLLGICLGVLVLVVVMPLRLELAVHKQAHWQFRAALRPFGRFGPRIPLSGRKAKADKPAKKKGAGHAPRRVGKLRIDLAARAGAQFVRDVLKRVRIETAHLQMRFGLGDPAETGQVFGYLAPVIYGTSAGHQLSLEVEPVFDRVALEGEAELDCFLVPAALVGPLFRFGWAIFGPDR